MSPTLRLVHLVCYDVKHKCFLSFTWKITPTSPTFTFLFLGFNQHDVQTMTLVPSPSVDLFTVMELFTIFCPERFYDTLRGDQPTQSSSQYFLLYKFGSSTIFQIPRSHVPISKPGLRVFYQRLRYQGSQLRTFQFWGLCIKTIFIKIFKKFCINVKIFSNLCIFVLSCETPDEICYFNIYVLKRYYS